MTFVDTVHLMMIRFQFEFFSYRKSYVGNEWSWGKTEICALYSDVIRWVEHVFHFWSVVISFFFSLCMAQKKFHFHIFYSDGAAVWVRMDGSVGWVALAFLLTTDLKNE